MPVGRSGGSIFFHAIQDAGSKAFPVPVFRWRHTWKSNYTVNVHGTAGMMIGQSKPFKQLSALGT
jgi:hypothetical protein